MDQFPAPVVPVFRAGNDPTNYAQIVDSNGLISGFELAPDLDDDRILAAGNYPYSEVRIGSPAQYAIAYSRGQVLINSKDVVARDIREYILVNRRNIKPFTLLELAMFTFDSRLIEDAAERCRQRLDATSPKLALKWLDGAPLSEEMKGRIRNGLVQIEPLPDPRRSLIRFGIVGPRQLMLAITSFCTNRLGRTRASVVKSLISPVDSSRRLIRAGGRVPDVVGDLVARYSIRDGYYSHEAWAVSRGAIRFEVENYDAFVQARSEFRKSLRESDKYIELLRLPSYSSGAEFSNFLLLLSILIEYQPGFLEYYREFFERPLGP